MGFSLPFRFKLDPWTSGSTSYCLVMSFSSVDFPLPLGPTMAKLSPGFTLMLIPFKILRDGE